MTPAQKQEIIILIDSFRSLSEEAGDILAPFPSAKSKVVVGLGKLDNFLCSLAGEKPKPQAPSRRFGPIEAPVKVAQPVAPKSQRQLEAEEIGAEADAVMATFLERDSAEILDAVTDIVIRVVAKRAGMEVTETDPEAITTDFIDQIKEKIKTDAEFKDLTDQAKQSGDAEKDQQEEQDIDDAFELLDELSQQEFEEPQAEKNQRLFDLNVVKEEYEKMLAEAIQAKAETKDKNEKKELTDRIKQLEADLAATQADIDLINQAERA